MRLFESFEDYKKSEEKRISDSISKTNKKVKCIKSLHKSTYKGCAFNRRKTYDVVSDEKETVFVLDNKGREFNFTKVDGNTQYKFKDYFKIN